MSEKRYLRTADGYLISPKRQAKKARALSARQEKKWRKEQRKRGFGPGRQDKYGNTVYDL